MSARSTSPTSKGSNNNNTFVLQNDAATYRDLLLFEERLKSNAANLQQRKAKYQLFLVNLVLVIVLLLAEVLFLSPDSSLLVIPYRYVAQRLLPQTYADRDVTLHSYIAQGLLFVSVTSLVLFFASGMYGEKIGYANKYVPHANRALRSYNIFLNVRRPPLGSKIFFNPLSFFFPRPQPLPQTSRARSQSRGPERSRSPTTSLTIPPIPPSQNPRGELIFSSKIDSNFREGYERYRAAFEKRREERERLARRARWWNLILNPFCRRVTLEPPAAGKEAPPRSVRPSSVRSSRSGTPMGRGTPPSGRSGLGDGTKSMSGGSRRRVSSPSTRGVQEQRMSRPASPRRGAIPSTMLEDSNASISSGMGYMS